MSTTTCESFIAIRLTFQYVLGRATPGTPASTFFKFPKPLRAYLQQLVKVSLQFDERCLLSIKQHRVLQLVKFSIFFNFQNHYEHVFNM